MKRLLLIIFLVLLLATPCFALRALIKVPIEQNLKTNKAATVLATLEQVPNVAKIDLDKLQVTDDLLWNTRIYGGYKLIHIFENITLKDLEQRINRYRLDWTILACNDGTKTIEVEGEMQTVTNQLIEYNFNEVINFIARKRIYDNEGNFLYEKDPIEIDMGTFQGAPKFKEAQ